MKQCLSCKEYKDISEFYANSRRNGLQSHCKFCYTQRTLLYNRRNPDNRTKWRMSNMERLRANALEWARSHSVERKQNMQRWRKNNPHKRREENARRKERQAGILLTVKVESDICGVCLEPLTEFKHPHPLSTSLGHEPPLSVAKRDGWLIITERPEHFRCNVIKGARTDVEMIGWRREQV
jgi:hypothetical protein